MTHYPPKDAEIMVWLLQSDTYTEAVFTNKVQAEQALRLMCSKPTGSTNWWIQEMRTQPHER